MFKTLGKTLLVLIATMMVADPLMACCFPASLETVATLETSVPQTDKPPCHGAKSAATAEPSERSGLDCPGCGDCSASMMSANGHIETLMLSSFAAEVELDNAADTNLDVTSNPISVALNIPSGPLPRIVTTPITLKLKLHV